VSRRFETFVPENARVVLRTMRGLLPGLDPGEGWPMHRSRSTGILALAFVLGLACADDGDVSEMDAARLCEAAEEKLDDCFSVSVAFVPCESARARTVLDMSCAQIVEDLAQPKADDPAQWFCTTFPEVCEQCESEPSTCA
jgi:hypothetical protein